MKRFDPDIFMAGIYHEAGEKRGGEVTFGQAMSLLGEKGEAFIVQAYAALLGRDPDPTGLAAYASKAKTLPGRLVIFAALYLSPERLWLPTWQRNLISFCRKARESFRRF